MIKTIISRKCKRIIHQHKRIKKVKMKRTQQQIKEAKHGAYSIIKKNEYQEAKKT